MTLQGEGCYGWTSALSLAYHFECPSEISQIWLVRALIWRVCSGLDSAPRSNNSILHYMDEMFVWLSKVSTAGDRLRQLWSWLVIADKTLVHTDIEAYKSNVACK